MPPDNPSSSPAFLWHNDVHKAWGGERLFYLFLAYEPTYNREAAVERMQRFLADQQVLAYQIYEMIGEFDMIVRAWIPARVERWALREELREADRTVTIRHILPVADVVHHWPWAKGKRTPIGQMHRPDEGRLQEGLPLRELEQLRELQSSTNGNQPGRALKPHRDDKLLTKPEHEDGIRFLILVKLVNVDAWESLQKRICTLLNGARSVIRNPSIYRFDDDFRFLIVGHVPEKEGTFHAISSRIVAPINDYAESASARTYSSFFAGPTLLDHRDELRLPPPPPKPETKLDVAEMLEQPEGQHLEVKGSAFTDLRVWLEGGKEPRRPAKPISNPSNKPANSLVRAVASLLNTDGGHVIVGAVEHSKFHKFERYQELPSPGGDEPLHRLSGIEFDYAEEEGFDDFARLVRELLEARLEPVPAYRWVKIRPAKLAGKDLCVIEIEKPDEWFWAKVDKRTQGRKRGRAASRFDWGFVVRVEGSTRQLKEREVEKYKKDNPRSKPLPID